MRISRPFRRRGRRSEGCARSTRRAPFRRPLFEALEWRRMLAVYLWDDATNSLSVTLGTSESLIVSESGGTATFTLGSGIFSQDAGSDEVAGANGTNSLSLANSEFGGQLRIASGVDGGTNDVTFSGNGSIAASSLYVDLGIDSAGTPNRGTIRFTGGFDLSTNGEVSLRTVENIVVESGSVISNTGSGSILLVANRQAAAVGGNFSGVSIEGGEIVTHGSGDIEIRGRGGNSGNENHGVQLINGARVESTSSSADAGGITINGMGGTGAAIDFGINTESNILVTSVAGDIRMEGTGVGTASGGFSIGVDLSGKIASTGVGANAAAITVDGTGGLGTSINHGIRLRNVEVASVDGDIQLTGEGSTGSGTAGIFIEQLSNVRTTGAANIALISDRIHINPLSHNVIDAGPNTVTIKTKTTNGSIGIDIGGGDSGSNLGLSDGELDVVSAGTFVIGDEAIANTIRVTAAIENNNAGFEVVTRRNILFTSNGAWTTNDRDLTFRANRGASAAGGEFTGILLDGGSITTHGQGDILLEGRGGSTGLEGLGIRLQSGATIRSTSSAADAGTITLDGIGGNDSGVMIMESDTEITSVAGDIRITGQAGTGGIGVRIFSAALVSSSGTGPNAATIHIDGTGGSIGTANHGISISGTASRVQSVDGDIHITGQGMGNASSRFDFGVFISNGGGVISTGTGEDAAKITINGAGGNGTEGNHGLVVRGTDPARVASVDGDIQITGIAGAGSDRSALRFEIGNSVVVTGTADVALIGDSMAIGGAGTTIDAGSNTVTLITESTDGSVGIDLGGADGNGVLGLTNAELNRIDGATWRIGNDHASYITISGFMFPLNASHVVLKAGGDIIFDGGSTEFNFVNSKLVLDPGDGAAVRPLTAGEDISTATVSFASDLAININGPTLDDDYDQLNVNGEVNLAGVDLHLTGSYAPSAGEVFVIVSAAEALGSFDGVVNQFNGLGDGDEIMFNGVPLRIRYTTTTVTLTANSVPVAMNDDVETDEDTPLAGTLTATDSENDDLTFSIVTGPTHGTITSFDSNTGEFTYEPDAHFSGNDSFTFRANDGLADSNTATISIVVDAVADAPNLTVASVAGLPGFSIALGIQSSLVDADGSETLKVLILGVPADAVFTQGNVQAGTDLGGGTWEFDPAELAGLSITLGPGHVGDVVLTATARSTELSNGDDAEASETLTISVSRIEHVAALGIGAGAKPWVQAIDATTGAVLSKFLAFSGGFRGGVSVAVEDMTGDGIPEIIAAQGPGGINAIRVFALDGTELNAFRKRVYPAAKFTGGVNLAVGDVNGDGLNDLVTAPADGKAQVRVYRNQLNRPNNPLGKPWRQFLAFRGGFAGGATVAVADMGSFRGTQAIDVINGDGKGEVIVGSGAGMRATIRVFNVAQKKPMLVRTMYPFGKNFMGGIASLDVGRVNADSTPDIVAGAGEGFGSIVRVLDGRLGKRLAGFRAYEGPSRRSPVRVAMLDVDLDGMVDRIVTAQGPGGTTREIRSFEPLTGDLVDSLLEQDADFFGEYHLAVGGAGASG